MGFLAQLRFFQGAQRREKVERGKKRACVHSIPENVCGESWHLVGNSCLKFITAKDSYDNAKLACRSHNAVLASLTTQKKVDFVLKELQIMSVVVSKVTEVLMIRLEKYSGSSHQQRVRLSITLEFHRE